MFVTHRRPGPGKVVSSRDVCGASLLMAKSRHKKAENVRRHFKPSPDAIAELTSLLAPGDTRRGGGT